MMQTAASWRQRGATMAAPEAGGDVTGRAALVLASGKGGVGKSVLTVTLGSVLAETGRKVLLLDGSQNMGNLHILLGCAAPLRFEQLLAGEVAPEEMLSPIAENLWLLPSDSGTDTVYALTALDRARLHYRLSTLYDRFDTVLVDSGPSMEDVVRLCTIGASGLVLVTVAEPTALADAYAVMKIVYTRVPGVSVNVLVNQVNHEEEGRAAFERLAEAGQRFLDMSPGYLGAVPADPELLLAARTPDRERKWAAIGSAAHALRGIVVNQPALFDRPTTHDQ